MALRSQLIVGGLAVSVATLSYLVLGASPAGSRPGLTTSSTAAAFDPPDLSICFPEGEPTPEKCIVSCLNVARVLNGDMVEIEVCLPDCEFTVFDVIDTLEEFEALYADQFPECYNGLIDLLGEEDAEECLQQLFCLWVQSLLGCCEDWMGDIACNYDGMGEPDCEDLKEFLKDFDAFYFVACEEHLTDLQLAELACCFVTMCEEDPEHGRWEYNVEGDCTALLECVRDAKREIHDNEAVALSPEAQEFLLECAGCCCYDHPELDFDIPDCSEGEDFNCDRDGSGGDIDCEDLRLFLEETLDCNDEMDREDIIQAICFFQAECGFCDFECVEDLLIEIFGEGAPGLSQDEVTLLTSGACGECKPDGDPGPIQDGDTAPRHTEPSCDGDASLDGPKAPDPVSVAHGDKFEYATDLVVPVDGRDFVLRRSYTSDPAYQHAAFVDGWNFSAFRFADYDDANNQLRLVVAAGEHITIHDVTGLTGTHSLPGSVTQKVIATSVTIDGDQYPVWRWTEPGAWEIDFIRDNAGGESGGTWVTVDDELLGLILQERDVYGDAGSNRNVHTYEWVLYPWGASGERARLRAVYLNGSPGAATPPDAAVIFRWNMFDEDHDSYGRLTQVRAVRFDDSVDGDPILAAKINYTYLDGPIIGSSALGSAGDLVQVTHQERVDRNLAGSTPFRTRITQYRYHDGLSNETSPTDTDGDTFIEQGSARQLKLIFQPEQIEFVAQQVGVPVTSMAAVILGATDDTVLFDDTIDIRVVDLASKVISKYETTGELRVLEQFIQSACGCGGTGTQGLRLEYEHMDYLVGGDDAWTLEITESKFTGSWTLHRTLYFDAVLMVPSGGGGGGNQVPVPYLTSRAIVSGGNEWATAFEYDDTTNLNLEYLYTPASISNYTPSNGSGAPSITFAGSGLVQKLTHSADHYQTHRYVLDGQGAADEYLVELIEYGNQGVNADERDHLVKRITRYRTQEDPPSTDADDKEVTEFEYGYHGGSGNDIAWVETKTEAELVAENGPGGSYHTYELFDTKGRNHWSRAADGALTKRAYDDDHRTGRLVEVERNDDGSTLPSNGSGDYNGMAVTYSTWTSTDRFADGGSLTTEYVLDRLGRVIERISPGLVSTYTLREMRSWPQRPGLGYYAEATLPHVIDAGTDQYDGPVTITWYNAADEVIGSSDVAVDTAGGYTFDDGVLTDWDEGAEIARSSIGHDVSGLVESSTIWHDVAGNDSYMTAFEYDALGRLLTTTDALGTETTNTYDVLDRVTQVEVGATGQSSVIVAQYEYDGGGVGNGNLTESTQKVNSSSGDDRVTAYTYDWRDRLQKVVNPVAPHRWIEYDNLDRVTAEAVFEVNPTGIDESAERADRGLYKRTSYSQRGLVYAQSIAIDPTVAVGSMTFLATNRWFDATGRSVGSWSPNGPMTKTTFDGLGRPEVVFVTDRRDDDDPGAAGNFADVYDASGLEAEVDDDVVLEQRNYRYISGSTPGDHAGMLDLVTTRRRSHDAVDADDGALSGLSSAKSIITYTGTYFDGADRVIRSVNYGTNQTGFVHGGTAPTITQSSPLNWNSGGDQLVTETAYNARGLVETTTDPTGQVTAYLYDDLSRTIAVIENFDDAVIVWDTDRWSVDSGLDDAEPDTDRVTSFVYDGGNNVIKQVAHQPDSSDNDDPQVTEYTYGVLTSQSPASAINHNGLLRQAKYPDSSGGGGTDVVLYAYNRLGETIAMKDQNESTHTYTRDDLGRVTIDAATKGGGSAIDDFIDSIEIAYDDLGRASTIVSKDSTTAVNGVKFEYTKLWQVDTVWQDADGNTFSGGTPTVQYDYDDNAVNDGNWSRLADITYPSGEQFNYAYGSSGNSDQLISRVTRIDEQLLSLSPQVAYDHVGLGMVSLVDYAIPDIQLDYQPQHNGTRTAGEYAGFDRFGRVIHHPWVDGNYTTHGSSGSVPNIPPIIELDYTYDKASNRLKMLDERPGALQVNRDMVYTYDDLDRLGEAVRGVDGGSPHVGSQRWTLDMLGNWPSFETDADGDGNYTDAGEKTNRSHNDVNELTGIDLDNSAGNELGLTYDNAGNLRQQQITDGSPDTAYRYTHDLWNRLVKVEHVSDPGGSETVVTKAEYEYYGTHWRSAKELDTDGSAPDQRREQYYSAGWQLVEERVDDGWTSGGGFTADRRLQYLWGIRYIDDIVMHREDHDGDGDFSDGGTLRWWHCTDVQFSTVAVLDDNATIHERVGYDAYGKARHHDDKDVDGDGDFDSTDRGILTALVPTPFSSVPITSGSYNADCDLNRDGVLNNSDVGLMGTSYVAALAPGELSNATVKNTIGWDGYVFNPEIAAGRAYLVRFRSYDTGLGRWVERDPAGYSDSNSLYDGLRSSPLRYLDTWGLLCSDDWDNKSIWHHMCPQEFRDQLGDFIDDPEFGLLMRQRDHSLLHSAGWNKDWDTWLKAFQKEHGRLPGREEVLARCNAMKGLDKYKHLISRGFGTWMSHGEWGSRVQRITRLKRLIAKRLALMMAKRLAKAIPGSVPVIGIGFSLWAHGARADTYGEGAATCMFVLDNVPIADIALAGAESVDQLLEELRQAELEVEREINTLIQEAKLDDCECPVPDPHRECLPPSAPAPILLDPVLGPVPMPAG